MAHLTSSSSAASPKKEVVILSRDENQALGIGNYAIDFINKDKPLSDIASEDVIKKLKFFHSDSVLCGISALALRTNAPTILRNEAMKYGVVDKSTPGACVFGSSKRCFAEKAIVANCSAVREWDSNGTVFGYNGEVAGHQAGEFGHNDFYPVVIAAAQESGNCNGNKALKAMLCLDEIRGRLAEVFSLKTHKIDHVVFGAIASAAVYGALRGATAQQIESAIGMTVAHYIPFRAIRAGKQLSDSKGASAALSTEVAVMSMKRAMEGFVGPKDIFRNPEAIFRWFEKQNDGHSPFNIHLHKSGDDFSVKGMHFKLGIYEHQSAGALEGLINLLMQHPEKLTKPESIKKIVITAYEPAYGIIGDPAKKNPQTRQSADHSMVYIVSTLLRKAVESKITENKMTSDVNEMWKNLILTPFDYGKDALFNPMTRRLMDKIEFKHGGKEFDEKYPLGIPTNIDVQMDDGNILSSGLVMFPSGHSRNEICKLEEILKNKFQIYAKIAIGENEKKVNAFIDRLQNIEKASNEDLQSIYNCGEINVQSQID